MNGTTEPKVPSFRSTDDASRNMWQKLVAGSEHAKASPQHRYTLLLERPCDHTDWFKHISKRLRWEVWATDSRSRNAVYAKHHNDGPAVYDGPADVRTEQGQDADDYTFKHA